MLAGDDLVASAGNTLVNTGALGVFALAALFFFWSVWKADQKEKAHLQEVIAQERADRAVLEKEIREKIMPALSDAVRMNAQSTAAWRSGR